MARFATILFSALTCILQVAGLPATHILFTGAAGVVQAVGAPASHKASNLNAEASLLDQLLESLSITGCSKLGRLTRATLKPPTEMTGD